MPEEKIFRAREVYNEAKLPELFDFSRNSKAEMDVQESAIARSQKSNYEDFLIAIYLYHTHPMDTTDELREAAAKRRGHMHDLMVNVQGKAFPICYDPLWLKVLNAMGISNLTNAEFH